MSFWSQDELLSSCLVLVLNDTGLAAEDDRLGTCAIDLRGAADEAGAAFQSVVLRDTAYNGFVEGTVKIVRKASRGHPSEAKAGVHLNDDDGSDVEFPSRAPRCSSARCDSP